DERSGRGFTGPHRVAAAHDPVAGGGLERVGLLEATAALFVGLWVAEQADVRAIAPPLAYATGPRAERACAPDRIRMLRRQ
ncbi:hypothetical protein ACIRJT_38760, partial [Streptomyces sp. NPDC102283]